MAEASIEFPYSIYASKNYMRARGRGGKVFLKPESKKIVESIIEQLKDTGPWYENKVWLGLMVVMPSRSSDAINVLELVADAVKIGIGIDDKWFAIEILDWSISKDDAIVRVAIKQPDEFNVQICSTCSHTKLATTEFFGKSKRGNKRTGLSYICKACKKIENEMRKKNG